MVTAESANCPCGTFATSRSPRGLRPRSLAMLVEVPVSFGHWKMTTFVAALRKHGITAPLVVDAPTNGEIFLAYLKPLAGVPRSCSGASTGVKVSHTL